MRTIPFAAAALAALAIAPATAAASDALLADATYVLDERLAVVPSSGVEIPVGTVSTVSDVTTLLLEALRRLP